MFGIVPKIDSSNLIVGNWYISGFEGWLGYEKSVYYCLGLISSVTKTDSEGF